MWKFKNTENVDMYLMHDAANDNGIVVQRLYQERFLNRHKTNHKMFQLLHQKLCENSSMIVNIDGRGRSRTV